MQNQSILDELKEHLIECIDDGRIDEDNWEDAHHHAFNEDYYIIYESAAKEWMKKHNIDAFEAISYCVQYEKDNFGEVHKDYNSAETTVNMLVYCMGHDVIPNADSWEEFCEELEVYPHEEIPNHEDCEEYISRYGICRKNLESESYNFVSCDDQGEVILDHIDCGKEIFQYRSNGYSGWSIDCKDGAALEFCSSVI